MSPARILEAVENYRGTIVDLDAGQVIAPARFVAAWHGLARRMVESGLSSGDRVIVAVGNGPLFIAVWAAVLAQEGSPVLVHMDTPPAELKRIADNFHARFIVTDAQGERELESAGIQASTFAGADWAEVVWGDTGRAAEASEFLALPGVPLHPTSGTTGKQKMAIRPVATGIAEVETYMSTLGVERRRHVAGAVADEPRVLSRLVRHYAADHRRQPGHHAPLSSASRVRSVPRPSILLCCQPWRRCWTRSCSARANGCTRPSAA